MARIVAVTLLAAIQLLRRFFPQENKCLWCWVPCCRIFSFPAGLSCIYRSQMLVIKALRQGFLTKLQLTQSFSAGRRFELPLLSIIHRGGLWSLIKQALLKLGIQVMAEGKSRQTGSWSRGLFHLPL